MQFQKSQETVLLPMIRWCFGTLFFLKIFNFVGVPKSGQLSPMCRWVSGKVFQCAVRLFLGGGHGILGRCEAEYQSWPRNVGSAQFG